MATIKKPGPPRRVVVDAMDAVEAAGPVTVAALRRANASERAEKMAARQALRLADCRRQAERLVGVMAALRSAGCTKPIHARMEVLDLHLGYLVAQAGAELRDIKDDFWVLG